MAPRLASVISGWFLEFLHLKAQNFSALFSKYGGGRRAFTETCTIDSKSQRGWCIAIDWLPYQLAVDLTRSVCGVFLKKVPQLLFFSSLLEARRDCFSQLCALLNAELLVLLSRIMF